MSAAPKRTSARKTYRIEWVERWTPPKPLVGLQAIEKVLNRHTFLVCRSPAALQPARCLAC